MNDFEAIIVSDGSTDNTKEVVRKYHDQRILFFEKENGGQSSARNLGIMKSRGEYISLCDDDDRLYPDHLMVLSQFLDTHRNIGLAYSDALWIYKDGSRKPEVRFSQDFDKKSLENYNFITTQTVMFRKTCLENTDLFNEGTGFRNGLEDWEFFLRLSDNYAFSHIKKVTSEYTVHEGNSFHTGSGYDYNRAFFFVRTQRFQYLISNFGSSLFDHVDHMYPFHLAQCYMNNGKFDEAVEVASSLYRLHTEYTKKGNRNPFIELVILFSLGISHFAAGHKERAKVFFDSITTDSCYESIKPQFNSFANQYAGKIPDAGLRNLLSHSFLQIP